jgi:hypothetical protein
MATDHTLMDIIRGISRYWLTLGHTTEANIETANTPPTAPKAQTVGISK